MENLFAPDCIRTVSGRYVNVFDPHPDMFIIEDIAHALSMMPRFGGHLPIFYSVAQHSIHCAGMAVGLKEKLSALMHDASEAYLMDISRPIKARLSNYKEIEAGLMRVLSERFSFQWPLSERVKEIDETALHYEWDNIMLNGKEYPNLFKFDFDSIKEAFINLYYNLVEKISEEETRYDGLGKDGMPIGHNRH